MYVSRKRINHLLVYLVFSFLFIQIKAQDQTPESQSVKIVVLRESNGSPVAGASASIQMYSSGLTDDNGTVTIKVPSGNPLIVISATGFQTKEVAVKGRPEITVKLFSENKFSFYNKVILPYNQTTSNKTAGAVTSVNVNEPWQNPSESSPENYMQGKIAGLDVKTRSGMPGIGTNFYLRGINSLNTINQPLIIVDGMPYDIRNHNDNVIEGYLPNPLQYINTNDIENISIIKDGTASIYGSKAANGVIVITTKHPEDLTTRIDFIASAGMNEKVSNLPLLNSSGYRTYLKETVYPVMRVNGMTDDQIQSLNLFNENKSNPDYYKYHNNTNWQNEIFDKSYNQNYYLRVTGGDDIGKYALSLNYGSTGGALINSISNVFGMRFNADIKMSKKFSVFANFSFGYNSGQVFDDGLDTRTNPVYLALVKAPFLNPKVVSSDGIVSPTPESADELNIGNPSAIIDKYRGTLRNYRFFGTVKADYKLSNDFTLSTLLGIPFDKVRQSVFVPTTGTLPDTSQNGIQNNRMSHNADRLFTIFNDTKIAFNKVTPLSSFDAAAGLRYSSTQVEGLSGTQYNSPNDQYHNIGTGSTAIGMRTIGGFVGDSKEMSMYSTVDYAFRNKYLLNLNVSLDGSSRFGDKADGITMFSKKFGVFPSVAAGWIVSSENFMSGLNFVDLFKLRASYGVTGNDDIARNTSEQYYTSKYIFGYYALELSGLANDQMQWEINKKTDVGLDAALFNEKLNVSFDVYRNDISNMLLYNPVLSVSGENYMPMNSGKMRNMGYELSVYTRLLNKRLKWDVNLTLARYQNKLTGFPEGESITDIYGANVRTKEGNIANEFVGYKTNGVYASDAEAQAANLKLAMPDGTFQNVQSGDVRFVDVVKDGIIDSKDMVVIGNPNPDFTGSFSTRLAYRRFALEGFFTFSYGNEIYNYQRRMLESMATTENQSSAVLNRWKYQGQITDMPRAAYGDPTGNARFSDRWIEDGSYLRLKTLTLTYNVPMKAGFFKYLTISASGYNVFTWTKYLGFNPDVSIGENYLYQGIDLGLAPVTRAVFLGVKLGL